MGINKRSLDQNAVLIFLRENSDLLLKNPDLKNLECSFLDQRRTAERLETEKCLAVWLYFEHIPTDSGPFVS